MKIKHNIDRTYGIAYCTKLKTKKFFEKGKVANPKLETSEISEILFRVFLFSSFRFCPIAKIENSDLKISEKKFPSFPSFRPGQDFLFISFQQKNEIKKGNALT